MNVFLKLLKASRPKTLIAGVCPVFLGACFSFYLLGHLETTYFLLILAASTLIQIATNFFNDALDADAGRDTENRKGPARMASSGELSARTLKIFAGISLFLALLIGIVLFLKSTWLVLLIGLPALFLAYLYTGTKASLSANGLADFFVITYFGVIPTWATNYILSGIHYSDALFVGLQCGLLCNALLLVNNLRDEAEDSSTAKRTLVVKHGRNFGLKFLGICLFAPYLLSLLMMTGIFFRAGLWSFLGLPLAVYIYFKVYTEEPSEKYNVFLSLTVLHLLLFTWMYCMGILSS